MEPAAKEREREDQIIVEADFVSRPYVSSSRSRNPDEAGINFQQPQASAEPYSYSRHRMNLNSDVELSAGLLPAFAVVSSLCFASDSGPETARVSSHAYTWFSVLFLLIFP